MMMILYNTENIPKAILVNMANLPHPISRPLFRLVWSGLNE